jgi:uncharacterized membrane protein YbaN (DUF454 family)
LLRLPQEAASDTDLHSVAARVLQLGMVRSLTVHSDRSTVVVRIQSNAEMGWVTEEAVRGLVAQAALATKGDAESVETISWVDPRVKSISFIRRPPRAHGWRKFLYLAVAGVALGLALLGIFLPGLPTTPFVLVASYYLVRSSTRLHEKLMTSRLYGAILRDWHVHRGVQPHIRARAITIVSAVVVISLLVARPPLPVVLVIAALALCGLTVIWRLPVLESPEFSSEGE